MSLKELYHNKWARFVFWALLYILWVIWLGNYWWLFGLVPIFDHHITRKVKWLFWKKEYKEGEKRNVLLDWLDAIIFAVVVVTFINTFFFQAFKIPSSSMESSLYTGDHLFVSKLAYGPKLPQTPLTIPFTHNVIAGKESYSTLIQNDYRRLKGFGKVKTGDYVVFAFPHGDSVFVKDPAADYYAYSMCGSCPCEDCDEFTVRYIASEEERRNALVNYALPLNIEGLERDLLKYKIKYDTWFRESTLHNSGAAKKVVDLLTEKGYTYENEGALWFKAEQFGCDKDFVLKRSNGFYTYIVPDIAYHYNKLQERSFDLAVDILGADHHGYVPRLKAALTALGINPDRLQVVLMQMVRLVKDGEVIKASKRSGKAITLVTLLEEVPIDAARFFFNMREANSHCDFDLDLAVEESSQNPVYYCQYAHARICSIFRKMEENGTVLSDEAQLKEGLLTHETEKELIRFIASLTGETETAAKLLDPSKLTRYAVDLATHFHKFYNACHCDIDDEGLKTARLTLCKATAITLKNVLGLLKVDAPEKM